MMQIRGGFISGTAFFDLFMVIQDFPIPIDFDVVSFVFPFVSDLSTLPSVAELIPSTVCPVCHPDLHPADLFFIFCEITNR